MSMWFVVVVRGGGDGGGLLGTTRAMKNSELGERGGRCAGRTHAESGMWGVTGEEARGAVRVEMGFIGPTATSPATRKQESC